MNNIINIALGVGGALPARGFRLSPVGILLSLVTILPLVVSAVPLAIGDAHSKLLVEFDLVGREGPSLLAVCLDICTLIVD